MGILRTNTVSGTETPTPVTGSVVFDGTGDYLTIPQTSELDFGLGDFTIELWAYFNSFNNSLDDIVMGGIGGGRFGLYLDSSIKLNFVSQGITFVPLSQANALSTGTWNHIAVVRKNAVLYGYINGFQTGSTSFNYTLPNNGVGIGAQIEGSNAIDGYISNLRILKGTALYTSNFTPPTRELQPIGDTVLLCCNNSTSATAEATGKTITVNGNAAASTFSPGLVRDFTYGTQFDGVTKFDTQGYFVPPSGNTQNRYTLGLDEIVTDGLVLHLDAGNPFSYPATGVGTKWTDLSGNNNHGTLNGGVSYTDNNRGALVFDGVNDYVQINQTLSTPFSITGFIRYTDQAKTINTFINTNPHTVLGISLNRTGIGDIYVYIGNGSNWLALPSIISSTNMNVNQWYHLSFTTTGSGSTLYLNGVNVGTSIDSPSGWGSTYYLGSIIIASGEYLRGNISNTQIYNRALTAAEVQQNYNALKGRYDYS